MLNKRQLVMSAVIVGLTACATAQENPNYEYSSRENGNEAVRTVSNTQGYQAQNAAYRSSGYEAVQSHTGSSEAGSTQVIYDRHRDFTNSSPASTSYSGQSHTGQTYPSSAPASTVPYTPVATQSVATHSNAATDYTYVPYEAQPSSLPSYQTHTLLPASAYLPQPVEPSPTDSAYAGQTVTGTPGYGVYIPEEAPAAAVP